MERRRLRSILLAGALAAGLSAAAAARCPGAETEGRWTAGDLHTHTVLSDGGKTLEEVAGFAFANGLDWFASTDHGGAFSRDRKGAPLPEKVPRWLTLIRESWPAVLQARQAFPGKEILYAFEWNVPGHEHANVAIAAGEPIPLSDFEYMCDARDRDAGQDLPKWNRTHADAVSCAAFLEGGYRGRSFILLNHPSRSGKYRISDLRDLNNAAPGVAFGFEGIPGHQNGKARGGYRHVPSDASDIGRYRTHGGADSMAAKVGGVWDALLGEGRRFFLFANSDFHDGEFRPGEYARTHVFVHGSGPEAVIRGLLSGNSFAATGGLVDALSFTAASGGETAAMGETLRVEAGDRVEISVAFRSPGESGARDGPRVDHIDLIAGRISGKAEPGSLAYEMDTNPTARVAARISAADWSCENGTCRARIDAGALRHASYFRLRGTNLPPSTPGETDGKGNPLPDDDPADRVLRDLWFYSNPIFVEVSAL